MRRPPASRTAALILVPLLALIGAGTHLVRSGWLYVWFPFLCPPALVLSEDGTGTGRLIRVSDGDTVVVRYHDLPLAVRLRNVDCAESVHPDQTRNTSLGKAASEFAHRHLAGARIRLELVRHQGLIDTDRYHRALAFLWIDRGQPGPDAADELFNETLIRQGWSRYETGYGNGGSHHGRLQAAEDQARAEGLGVWSKRR